MPRRRQPDHTRISPRHSQALRSIGLIMALLSAVLAIPLAAQAPTAQGAPFLANAERSEHVLARLDAMFALESLQEAQRSLALRSSGVLSAPGQTNSITSNNSSSNNSSTNNSAELIETRRIIDAQINSVERTLDTLSENEAVLLEETAPFGIALAMFPVDEVRKPFWDDWGRPRSGGRTHIGTDVLAQIGVPLRAIEDGEVEVVSGGGNGGNGIFLLGESGSRYYYAHMDEVADLRAGDAVLAGQIVGTVGDTGNARGAPHLHMQWDPGGGSNWQNPFPMLDTLFGAGRTQAFAESVAASAGTETEPDDDAERDVSVGADDLTGTDSQFTDEDEVSLLNSGVSPRTLFR